MKLKDEGRKQKDEVKGMEEKSYSSFISKRVITGLVLLALVLAVLLVPHPLPLAILVWMLGMVGMWEYMELIEAKSEGGRQKDEVKEMEERSHLSFISYPLSSFFIRLTTSFFTLTLVIAGCYLKNLVLVLGAFCLPFACFSRDLFMFRKDPEEWFQRQSLLGLFVMGPVYLGPALGLAVYYKVNSRLWPLIFVAACVWTGDTGAYYVGRAVGKHPLHPLSPKKTWEGTAGGLIVGSLAAMAVGLVGKLFPWWEGLILGALVNLAGQLGDLLESFLKRVSGVKDSGKLFPGHGGVLDRIDSLLLALPFYALITGLTSLF